MNQFLADMIGKAVLGNIWSTTIGGGMVWSNAEQLMHLLASGPTVGQLITSPVFQASLAGLIGMVGQLDHAKLPQLVR